MQPDKDNLPQTDGQAPTSKSANESITGSTQPYSESVTGGAQSVGDGTAEGSYSTLGSQVAGVAAAALVAPVAAAGYLASAISSSGKTFAACADKPSNGLLISALPSIAQD